LVAGCRSGDRRDVDADLVVLDVDVDYSFSVWSTATPTPISPPAPTATAYRLRSGNSTANWPSMSARVSRGFEIDYPLIGVWDMSVSLRDEVDIPRDDIV